MPAPQKEALRLVTTAERAALTQISRASSERIDRVRRATALLAVAQGQSLAQAARQTGFHSGSTVAALVRRFNQRGVAAVTIAPGRGRTPTYDTAARSRIVATAQRPPERKTDGTATWSLSTLQRALRQVPEGLPTVSTYAIWKVLRETGMSWQKTRSWCATGKVKRKRKSGVVEVTDPDAMAKKTDRAGLHPG